MTPRAAGCCGSPRRHGFTLVELLVAMVIVALLVSVMLPAMGNTKGAAVLSSVRSDAGALAQTLEGDFTRTRSFPSVPSYTTDLSGLRRAALSPGNEFRIAGHSAGGTGALLEVRRSGEATMCRVGLGDQLASTPLACTP